MKTKKKMNTYLKCFLLMAVCVIAGVVMGVISALLELSGVGEGTGLFVRMAGENMAVLVAILAVISVVCGEVTLMKMRRCASQIPDADEEEGDMLEYRLELAGGVGMVFSHIALVGGMLLISTCYSLKMIRESTEAQSTRILVGLLIFLALCFYEEYWQVRYVKLVQKLYPEKKGDPVSLKFQKEWLESCDEAEKEMIFQSTYGTYRTMSVLFPVLELIAMVCHLIWNTGLLAVVLLGVAWIVQIFVYCRSCVVLRKKKLRG